MLIFKENSFRKIEAYENFIQHNKKDFFVLLSCIWQRMFYKIYLLHI